VFTVWAARLAPGALLDALRRDSGPPLFYVLEKPFVRLGEAVGDDRFARALPFVAALAVLLALRRLPRGAATTWFAVLAACSPFLLLYSGEARAYALLAAFDLAVFLLLFGPPPTAGRLAAGALAAAAALWTHYLAVFFLAAAGLLLLATRRWRSAAAIAAGGVLFLPWLPVLRAQPPEATAWIHEGAARSAFFFLAGLGGGSRVPLPVGIPLPPLVFTAAAFIGAALAVLLAAGARDDAQRRDAILLTGGTLALLLAVSAARPVAVAGRSEMAILPIWWIAVASGAASGRTARGVAAASILVGIVTCALTVAAPRPEPPTARVARLVARAAAPKDRVIASTAFYLPLRLAADRGQLRADLRAFPLELAGHPGWFVPAPPPSSAYRDLGTELAGVAPGGRAFLVAHPLWAGPELARVIAAGGTARDLVRDPDALVVAWSPGKREAEPRSAVPAPDRQQREPERGR